MITKETYKEIQGWLTDKEASALQLISQDKNVLEIGVWKARSTLAIAATAKNVIAVDHFQGDNFTGKAFTLPEAIENIRKYDDSGKVSLVIQDYLKLQRMRATLATSEVVYYDADHSRQAVQDFVNYVDGTFAIGKTVIAFHDYEISPTYVEGVNVFQNWFNFWKERGLYNSWSLVIVDRLAVVIPFSKVSEYPQFYAEQFS